MKEKFKTKQTLIEEIEILAEELLIANKELVFQNEEKEKRAEELLFANKKLAFLNEEKKKRAEELLFANKELAFQNEEKKKIAKELLIANKELAFQNEEKEKRAEELLIAYKELVQQNEIQKRAEQQIFELNRVYAVLSNVNQAIVRIHDVDKLFEKVCDISVSVGKFKMSWIGEVNSETNIVDVAYSSGDWEEYLSFRKIDLSDGSYGRGTIGQAVISGKYEYSNDIENDTKMAKWKDLALKHNFRSVITLPIITFGKTKYAFSLYSDKVGIFDYDEIRLLDEMAKDISFCLEYIQTESDRKKSELALKESEERFRGMIENAHDLIWEMNTEGDYVFVNKRYFDVTGYKKEDLISVNFASFVNHEDLPIIMGILKAILEGKPQSYEVKIFNSKGEPIFLSVNSVPIFNNDLVTGMFSFGRNITEQKRSERELIIAKDKAEEMNRLKSSFLANMSHELRTPMIGIMGFSDLLSDSEESADVKEMSGYIYQSAKRLMDTLNLILDLSRIEAGEQKLYYTSFDLIKELNESIHLFKANADAKNLYISFVSELNDFVISSDLKIFTSIINNLINNAVKFTQKGGIKISLAREEISGGECALINVTDTGIGIKEENIEGIFTEFKQVSEGIGRNYEGNGLGLAIVKKYLTLLNGTISFKSKLGVGTTFIVRLPINKDTKQTLNLINDNNPSEKNISKIVIPKQKKSILLIEDDTISSILFNKFLNQKYLLDTANNGLKSIAMAKSKHYDCLLMDINLGKGMDGVQAAQKIRVLPGYENVPIVALTAYAMVSDKEEFLSKGFDYYLSKPCENIELMDLLNEIFK